MKIVRDDQEGNFIKTMIETGDLSTLQDEMLENKIQWDFSPENFFGRFGIEAPEGTDFKMIWHTKRSEIAQSSFFKNDETIKTRVTNAKLSEQLQKVTYKVEEDEDFEAIYQALKNSDTMALGKAVVKSEEEREITIYKTKFGTWQLPNGEIYVKQVEGGSKNQLRNTYTVRNQDEPLKLSESSRINFAVLEDAQTLFEAGLIKDFNNFTEAYFKYELTDEEKEQLAIKEEAQKIVKKETSHTEGKTNATTQEMEQTIAKNEEIFRVEDQKNLDFENVEKFENNRKDAVLSHLESLKEKFEREQALARQVLEEKINSVLKAEDRLKIKKEAVALLQAGMNLQEMSLELQAKKYNDLQIQIANEELKQDIIDSQEKESNLKKVSKKLAEEVVKSKTEEKAKEYFKSQFEAVTKLKNEMFEENRTLKIGINDLTSEMLQLTELFETKESALNATVSDLKADKAELNRELEELEEELNLKYEEIENFKNSLVEKEKAVASVSAEKMAQNQFIQELKDEKITNSAKIETLTAQNAEVSKDIAVANAKLENLQNQLEAQRANTSQIIGTLRQKNETLATENEELKQQLNDFLALKKELEIYKKNEKYNENLKAKNEELKQQLSKDDEIIQDLNTQSLGKSTLDLELFNRPSIFDEPKIEEKTEDKAVKVVKKAIFEEF